MIKKKKKFFITNEQQGVNHSEKYGKIANVSSEETHARMN